MTTPKKATPKKSLKTEGVTEEVVVLDDNFNLVTAPEDEARPETELVSAPMVEESCPSCKTLIRLCICAWRNNTTYDCECSMCPCMASVPRENALCNKCKEHDSI